jgi:glycosyltransferase involved in cell wall biosynthesis
VGYRILHCLRAPVGGLFRHVRDLSAEQARRGHAVGVVCDAVARDALTETRLAELEPYLALGLLRTRMSRELGANDVAAYLAIRRNALAMRIDVMHGHGAKGGAYARLVSRALKRAGLNVVSCYTPHGGSLHYAPHSMAGLIYMQLERGLARATDALAFESAFSAGRYIAQVTQPACPVRIIRNGLGGDDFAPVHQPEGAVDFLFVGELRRLKGIDVMLRALASVREARSVRALIVGTGPDGAAFKNDRARLGLQDIVSFRDAMPAREAFALGRALVVPSRAESFPYIVLEAAAAGLPILATNVGGIPEIVLGTDTELLPAANADALARAMLTFLDNPAAAQAKALKLQAAVARRFSVAAMADGVLDLYAAVMARRLSR